MTAMLDVLNKDFIELNGKLSEDLRPLIADIGNTLSVNKSKNLEAFGSLMGAERVNDPRITDEVYKKIILAQIMKNETTATIRDLELQIPQIVSSSRCRIIDHMNMTYEIIFEGKLTDTERFLVEALDLLPRPSGVELVDIDETELQFEYDDGTRFGEDEYEKN
jgi:hypothetical protein